MNEENDSRRPESDGPSFGNPPPPPYQGLPPVRPTNAPPMGQTGPFPQAAGGPPPMGRPGPFPPPPLAGPPHMGQTGPFPGGPPPYPNGYGANMPPQRPGGLQGGPQYQVFPPNFPPQMGPFPPQGSPNYQQFPQPPMYMPPVQALRVPKCTNCGALTPWVVEPMLTTMHIIITVVLLLFFGFGLLYLLIVALTRSNPESRAKVCPHCGAKNMWTFAY